MKKWLSLGLVLIAAAAMVYMEDCGGPTDTPPVRNLDFTIIDDAEGNPGGAITVEWDAPDNVTFDGYIVEVDGVASDLLETTTYDVSTPAALTEVFVDYGSDGLSTAEDLDFGCMQTPSLDVWDVNDLSPDHESGFGFRSDGTAEAYALTGGAHDEDIDFWMDADPGTGNPILTAPSKKSPAINNEANASANETGTYEGLEIASPTGQGLFTTNQPLSGNQLLSIWINSTDLDYMPDDNFGKIHIMDITGDQVNMKLALQTIDGLRWIVVD